MIMYHVNRRVSQAYFGHYQIVYAITLLQCVPKLCTLYILEIALYFVTDSNPCLAMINKYISR